MSLGMGRIADDPLLYLFHVISKRASNYALEGPQRERPRKSASPTRDPSPLNDNLSLRIPETIFYEHNFARIWFKYEGSDFYKKTGKEVTDTNAIYNSMVAHCRSRSEGAVVAQYITSATPLQKAGKEGYMFEKEGCTTGIASRDVKNPATLAAASALEVAAGISIGDDEFDIRFLTRAQLREFLNEHGKGERGILQQFIPPKADHVDVVKLAWTGSANSIGIIRRENQNSYSDTTIPPYERCITEKPYINYVTEGKIAPVAQSMFRELFAKLLVDIKKDVPDKSTERVVNRVVIYMKVDRNNTTWLQFSPILDIQDRPRPALALSGHTNLQSNTGDMGDQITKSLTKHGHSLEVGHAPLAVQYEFFKQSLLVGPLLHGKDNPLHARKGITPQQSLLLGEFESLVKELEATDGSRKGKRHGALFPNSVHQELRRREVAERKRKAAFEREKEERRKARAKQKAYAQSISLSPSRGERYALSLSQVISAEDASDSGALAGSAASFSRSFKARPASASPGGRGVGAALDHRSEWLPSKETSKADKLRLRIDSPSGSMKF